MDQGFRGKPAFPGASSADNRVINPIEIDDILTRHPKIKETCSVRVPDEDGGETIKVFVVLNPGEALSDEEVTAFCAERFSVGQIRAIVEFVDSLPRSPMGKILRGELLERGTEKTKK